MTECGEASASEASQAATPMRACPTSNATITIARHPSPACLMQ
jgi:hypothetical protein